MGFEIDLRLAIDFLCCAGLGCDARLALEAFALLDAADDDGTLGSVLVENLAVQAGDAFVGLISPVGWIAWTGHSLAQTWQGLPHSL